MHTCVCIYICVYKYAYRYLHTYVYTYKLYLFSRSLSPLAPCHRLSLSRTLTNTHQAHAIFVQLLTLTLFHSLFHSHTLQLHTIWMPFPWIQLQHSAIYCNTLRHTANTCQAHTRLFSVLWTLLLTHNTLQHTATHCNTLQHTATHSPGTSIIGSFPADSAAWAKSSKASENVFVEGSLCNMVHFIHFIYFNASFPFYTHECVFLYIWMRARDGFVLYI